MGMQDAEEEEGSMPSALNLGEGLTSGHLDNPALPSSPAQHPGQGTGRVLLRPTAFCTLALGAQGGFTIHLTPRLKQDRWLMP